MSNAINKLQIIAAAAIALTACTTEAERRAAAADNLREQAAELIKQGDNSGAIVLLDSLDSTYHEQTAARRAALPTRAEAIAGLAMQQMGPADQRLAAATLRTDSLKSFFTEVEGPRGLEGYRIAKGLVKQNVASSTGIQPRIDNDGYISIAAVVKGKQIGLNSLSLTTHAGNFRSEIISSDRRINSEGSELASFRQEEVAELLTALEETAASAAVKMFLDGEKGSVELKMSDELRKALVQSWQYSKSLQELQSAKIDRERLERILATARDHMANTIQP